MIQIKTSFSRWVLVRLSMLAVIALLGLLYSREFINEFYFNNQLTQTGIIINSGILLLFLLGLIKVVGTLLHYVREESTLTKFLRQIEKKNTNPIAGISSTSIIAMRFEMMRTLSEQRAPINHSALASTLLADESTRISFARYINNILILSGVFGTIVSLSIALLGASDLFESVENISNMGLVVHGMSAALSTTMTAIVCYVFFGYFFFKLVDAQTHLVSAVEQITTFYLMPKFSVASDQLQQSNVVALIERLRDAAEGLIATQATHKIVGSELINVVREMEVAVQGASNDFADIKKVLREGFRLPDSVQ